MTDATNISEKKARGRPFAKGGDPRIHKTGRTPGAKGKRAAALLELLRPEGERLLARAVQLALDEKKGDAVVLRDLLGRLLPAPERGQRVRFSLPTGASLVEQSQAVLAALAAGDITTEDGAKLSAALASHARVVEVHELAERLERLEARLGGA